MIKILLSLKPGGLRWMQSDLARKTGTTINDLCFEIAERVNLEHLDLKYKALDCELSDIVVMDCSGCVFSVHILNIFPCMEYDKPAWNSQGNTLLVLPATEAPKLHMTTIKPFQGGDPQFLLEP